jgi:hypothetical protein
VSSVHCSNLYFPPVLSSFTRSQFTGSYPMFLEQIKNICYSAYALSTQKGESSGAVEPFAL